MTPTEQLLFDEARSRQLESTRVNEQQRHWLASLAGMFSEVWAERNALQKQVAALEDENRALQRKPTPVP